MKFCPFCGVQLLSDVKFCGNCGRSISKQVKEKRIGCYICGKQELLPFTCNYCKRVFCAQHRLPENHDCTSFSQHQGFSRDWATQVRRTTPTWESTSQNRRYVYEGGQVYPVHAREPAGFSPPPGMDIVTLGSEIRDLALGTLLIAIFVFTIFLQILIEYGYTLENLILAVVGAFLASVTAFVCHELAHRYFAIRAGMLARFVLWRQGLYLTVFMIAVVFLTGFPAIAAPGFVLIQGFVNRETNGKISAAGPSVNVIFGSLFLLLSVPFGTSVIGKVLLIVAVLNGILALFNLIPFGNLDGRKVMDWNSTVWISLVVLAFIIFICAFLLVY